MLDILEEIKNDISKQADLDIIRSLGIFEKHFVVGAYIRNKYLLKNPRLVKELNAIFKTDNLDDLSAKMLAEILK